eukprot:4993905-Amphidinium_carterae.1
MFVCLPNNNITQRLGVVPLIALRTGVRGSGGSGRLRAKGNGKQKFSKPCFVGDTLRDLCRMQGKLGTLDYIPLLGAQSSFVTSKMPFLWASCLARIDDHTHVSNKPETPCFHVVASTEPDKSAALSC